MKRREFLGAVPLVGLLQGKELPAPPVAIARCPSYNGDLTAVLDRMFDQLGGLGHVVSNKTVTVKLNLTGSPALRFMGRPLGVTHYSHPKMVGSVAFLLHRAGARRVRFVESCANTAAPMEEYMLDSGWNVRQLKAAAPNIEFENTNALGQGKKYSRLKVPGGGLIFPAYDLNHSYEDTDVFMSMAKLKEHETCGITLSLKNCFGNTPASIYGDDAGEMEPNENPAKGRVNACHFGKRQPAASAPGEINPSSSREPGYRMPRITAEICSARPVDIALVDGVETIAGGEGPWNKGIRLVQPGVILASFNPVTADAVGAALMGFDPRAPRGKAPFETCDNTLLLAEQFGTGSADLKRIEVRGVPISEALFPFRSDMPPKA
jgi:uncharacterized protein (DUF362 family)